MQISIPPGNLFVFSNIRRTVPDKNNHRIKIDVVYINVQSLNKVSMRANRLSASC